MTKNSIAIKMAPEAAVGLVKIRSQKNIITGMKINVIKTIKFCTLSRFADESHQSYENDRVQNDEIL
jgi:hypothetical protein